MWQDNIVQSREKLGDMWNMMNDRIFRGDKTGWYDCWVKMDSAFEKFEWTRMSTKGGYCGASALCLKVKMVCCITWDSYSQALELAKGRAKCLSFFGCKFNTSGDPNVVPVR